MIAEQTKSALLGITPFSTAEVQAVRHKRLEELGFDISNRGLDGVAHGASWKQVLPLHGA